MVDMNIKITVVLTLISHHKTRSKSGNKYFSCFYLSPLDVDFILCFNLFLVN